MCILSDPWKWFDQSLKRDWGGFIVARKRVPYARTLKQDWKLFNIGSTSIRSVQVRVKKNCVNS